jgi:4-amino-4-deoxy-L-arabinose transferase-like glycosyltransferase
MKFSLQSTSAASAPASAAAGARMGTVAWRSRARALWASLRGTRPELLALMGLAALLNLWALSRNGWANDYYSAAVRSMSSSWHDFLFGSLDRSGVMTVDKPPLALWVQALSVRMFGYSSLSILVPQALEGVASVALLYDLVRRMFGRVGGFAAGLALALTPMTVAISRHNNPDALLVLCVIAALWFTVRGLQDGRMRSIVLAGVCVGLGFETKMGVALTVVPGIVAAWLWIAPAAKGRLHALRQLLAGGGAMLLVGGAWPALVELTPAADRPWISGTSDNRILSLIFEYNGVGRVDGQTGGPGGGLGGNMFGGSAGPLRLLNSALGGQASWLLGFALVGGIGILLATRLRASSKRSGWLIAVGGGFLATAVLFSIASGIFHPYYVSLLAPFVAALFGAGIAQLLEWPRGARVLGPLAIAAGVVVELVIRSRYPGTLPWLAPVLVVTGIVAIVALIALSSRRVRLAALGAVGAALLAAPAVWAFDTLGYATSSTFPAGGPASAEQGGFGGGPGASGSRLGGRGLAPGGIAGSGATARAGASEAGVQLFGPGSSSSSGRPPGAPGAFAKAGAPTAGVSGGRPGSFGGGSSAGGAGGGSFGGSASVDAVLSYVKQHGGGTIAVSSQSSAASAIIQSGASVAGIGGFSGRESDVSVAWLAQEVRSGKIRWVLDEEGSGSSTTARAGLPGDSRKGSKAAISAAAAECRAVTVSSSAGSESSAKLYDCQGRAGDLLRAGAQESQS